MEGSRGPGEDGPRRLGVELCASWSGVAQQHYYPAMSLFWGVVDFRYLPWLVSGSSFGAGTGERKGSASDQTEMTAMHLFLPPPYFFLHRAHITGILSRRAWIGTAGVGYM